MKPQKVVKEAVEIIVLVVLTLVASLVIAPRLLTTDVPLAVVASYSMEPVLRLGDLILVNGAVQPSVGEVIVYESLSGSLIVHRIVEVRETLHGREIITKGDANVVRDAPVPIQMVKGRVDLVVPYIGVARLALGKLLRGLMRV